MDEQKDNVTTFPSRAEAEAILSDPQEKQPDEIRMFTDPKEIEIATKILPTVVQRVSAIAEAKKAKELDAYIKRLSEDNATMMKNELEKLQKEYAPLSSSEVGQLLKQEYLEFPVKTRDKNGEREFVIREMSQAAELKFVKVLQKTIVPRIKEFSSIDWTSGMTMLDKIQTLVEAIPETLDMLAELCVISLDPYGDESVTLEWVQKNLSSYRIASIIEAQIMASRVRDFFSAAFRLMPSMKTI